MIEGRLTVPKRISFQKSSKGLWPSSSFSENHVAIFFLPKKTCLKSCLFKVPKSAISSFGLKNIPHPPWTLSKNSSVLVPWPSRTIRILHWLLNYVFKHCKNRESLMQISFMSTCFLGCVNCVTGSDTLNMSVGVISLPFCSNEW